MNAGELRDDCDHEHKAVKDEQKNRKKKRGQILADPLMSIMSSSRINVQKWEYMTIMMKSTYSLLCLHARYHLASSILMT